MSHPSNKMGAEKCGNKWVAGDKYVFRIHIPCKGFSFPCSVTLKLQLWFFAKICHDHFIADIIVVHKQRVQKWVICTVFNWNKFVLSCKKNQIQGKVSSSKTRASLFRFKLWCISCPLFLVHVLVHFHFNLVSLILGPFQIGTLGGVKWWLN